MKLHHKIKAVLICSAFPFLLPLRIAISAWRVVLCAANEAGNQYHGVMVSCERLFQHVGSVWRNAKCKHGKVIGAESCTQCTIDRMTRRGSQ